MKNLIPTFDEFILEQKEIEAKEADEKTNTHAIKEEEDIKDKESFKEYVFAKLKKEHGEDFDEKKAQKIVDGISKEVEDGDIDWGAAVGKIQNS